MDRLASIEAWFIMETMAKTCDLFCLFNVYQSYTDSTSLNQVLRLEIAAAGTPFSAPSDAVRAIETLIDGDRWMIYRNTNTKVLHWDFVRISLSNLQNAVIYIL
jgi:hypothetical protein